ncbi:MAG: hypothetical protein WCI36_04960, partial [bacterium]
MKKNKEFRWLLLILTLMLFVATNAQAGFESISMPNFSIQTGQKIFIPVTAKTNTTDFRGFEMDVIYDKNIITIANNADVIFLINHILNADAMLMPESDVVSAVSSNKFVCVANNEIPMAGSIKMAKFCCMTNLATLPIGDNIPVVSVGFTGVANTNQTSSVAVSIDLVDSDGVNLTPAVSSILQMVSVSPPVAPTTFALNVTKSGTGTGTVSSSPAGISCGATCSANFNSGANVVLTATPTAGSTFTGWTGACSGTNATCTVGMSAGKSVGAGFVNSTLIFKIGVFTKGTWYLDMNGNGTWDTSDV